MSQGQQHAIEEDQRGGMTTRLLTNCSNTLRNIHANARDNVTRILEKRKPGYFFVAHSVYSVTAHRKLNLCGQVIAPKTLIEKLLDLGSIYKIQGK